MITVTCTNETCENYSIDIEIVDWDGSQIICGPCGAQLEEQAPWHVPPTLDDTTLAGRILSMPPEELDTLIEVLNNVRGQ